jgi:hypothetical protein
MAFLLQTTLQIWPGAIVARRATIAPGISCSSLALGATRHYRASRVLSLFSRFYLMKGILDNYLNNIYELGRV